jgi:uncharacterized protein YecT (DUF1311 family)
MCPMRIVLSCLLAAASPGSAFAQEPVPPARAALEECGRLSQAGMRECLLKKVNDSRSALAQAEEQVRQAVGRWDSESRSANLAVARLVASGPQFAKFRDAHCAFESSPGGAAGNVPELPRLACVLELNLARTAQLGAAVASLPGR